MKIWNLFKREKKVEKQQQITLKENNYLLENINKKITPNTFTSVSRRQFIQTLSKHNFEPEQWFGSAEYAHNPDEFQIFAGDIEKEGELRFGAMNLLVIGSISTTWLNTINETSEGGSLFVTNAVECDFFSNYYGKLTVIGGNLHAKKIINNEFYDAALVVKKNLKTEYFHGVDIWAEVGGSITMSYGNGYCLPIGYDNPSKQHIKPQYDKAVSKAFLGVNDDTQENINALILSKLTNYKL